MNYNLHPIFVHFPIAFLFVYSLVIILPLRKWAPSVAWKDMRRAFLAIGLLGAFVALATGDTAEHLTHYNRQIIEIHSDFAAIATTLYGLLIAGEIAALFNEHSARFSDKWELVKSLSTFLEKLLGNRKVVIFLATLALIAIIVTGILGGAIVYGATADPLAPYILKLFGITI